MMSGSKADNFSSPKKWGIEYTCREIFFAIKSKEDCYLDYLHIFRIMVIL